MLAKTVNSLLSNHERHTKLSLLLYNYNGVALMWLLTPDFNLMTQFGALIWLKWTLFRNAMRSRKAVVNRIAGTLGTLAALALALLIAVGLGFAAYAVASPDALGEAQVAFGRPTTQAGESTPTSSFFLFMIFALLYLMWATVPLSMGGGSRFDPGRLLLYPISLRKLFAIDLLSELASLTSIFAVPAVFAVAIGAGLRNGNVLLALVAAVCATAFGVALAKWLATSIGALMQRQRTRGETLLALVGAVAGLVGAFAGQLVPIIARHGGAFRGMRWTPPGAAAVALMSGLRPGGTRDYALALFTLTAYTVMFVVASYWVGRRAALNMGGAKRRAGQTRAVNQTESYAGWQLPFLSAELSAVIEKEMRYAMRNAQLRMMALMPLILIGVRFAQGSGFRSKGELPPDVSSYAGGFALYGEGLLVAVGVLYVFLILSSLACNLFAYEGGGMRAYVLSPLDRSTILLGKNLTVTLLALVFAAVLIVINQLVFRDLTLRALGFAALCFLLFAACFALVGNWFSIRFPKRLQFGKRMNVSGVAGLLLIPIMICLAIPPVLAALAGWLMQSLLVKYATLTLFAGAALSLYVWLIRKQGRALAQHELEILEAVNKDEL